MEKKDKVNFEVIRYVLEHNRKTQKDYIAILFQSMLNEVFYPKLEKEQEDLKIVFSRELIFDALLETVKKNSEVEREIIVRVQKNKKDKSLLKKNEHSR